MSYQPFPILDFDGLFALREPWLSPEQAFTTVENCYVHRGRLLKRPGASWMQTLGNPVVQNLGVGGPLYVTRLASRPWNIPHHDAARPIPGTDYNVRIVGVNSVSGTMTIVIGALDVNFGNGRLRYFLVDEGTTTGRGTITWDFDDSSGLDGNFTVTFPAACDVSCEVQYETVPGDPVMLFETFRDASGIEHNLCFTTRRCYKLDVAEGWWYNEESSLGNIWTGAVSDPFHSEPFDDILVINNGKDAPYKFDPTASPTLQAMATDFDSGSPGNDIDNAKMFFNVRGYPVYLATQENGTAFRGRARWAANGDPETFSSVNDFLDAPENDEIVTAGAVAGDLYIGFKTVGWWRLEFTGDETSPFAWVPVESYLGAVARLGTVKLADRLLTRTTRGFSAVNRLGEVEIAQQLSDLPLTWCHEHEYLTTSLRYDHARQVWWTYCRSGLDYTDRVLVLQQELDKKEHWSIWFLTLSALGYYNRNTVLTYDDVDDSYDSIDWSYDSASSASQVPVIVGGDNSGNIYEFKGRATDSTDLIDEEFSSIAGYQTPISMRARTIPISPFPGRRAKLGFVDIFATANGAANVTLRFYGDHDTAAYLQRTLTLDSNTRGKVRRRVLVNYVATFHEIEIEDTTNAGVSIDGVIPWFKPAGRDRETV